MRRKKVHVLCNIKANKSQWNIKNIYCRVPAKFIFFLTKEKY